MKYFLGILFSVMLFTSYGYSQRYSYEKVFHKLDFKNAHKLLPHLDLDSTDYKRVAAAIKRVGQLKYTNAYQLVYNWFIHSNPFESASGDGNKLARLRNIYHYSIWTIGKIGTIRDARDFAVDVTRTKDQTARVYYVDAIGDIGKSVQALSAIEELCLVIKEQRVAKHILAAILKFNRSRSYDILVKMAARAVWSKDFKREILKAAEVILLEGK